MQSNSILLIKSTLLLLILGGGSCGKIDLDNGNYILETSSNAETINITVTALGLGYIGFGISPSGQMAFSDIIISGFNSPSNEGYIRDSFATGPGTPSLDVSQDVTLLHASENGTHTTVSFQRKLVTGDNWDDLVIQDRPQYILWARGETDNIMYHKTLRGSILFNLLE